MTTATTLDTGQRHQLSAGRWALARVEARRAVTSPFFLVSFALSGWLLYVGLTGREDWTSAHYNQVFIAVMPLVIGTIATANLMVLRAPANEVFGGAVPVDADHRRQGQLLAGIAPCALVGLAVVVLWIIAQFVGGDSLGEVQARVVVWSVPEVAQSVLLVGFSWVFGCALAKLVPNRVAGLVVAFFVGVIFVGASWIFGSLPIALVQVQPFEVDLPATFDPADAPADWILTSPDEDNDRWRQMVVSPAAAASHNLYLVGLTLAWSAVVWTGRRRWQLLAGGMAIAAVGVAWQVAVWPA